MRILHFDGPDVARGDRATRYPRMEIAIVSGVAIVLSGCATAPITTERRVDHDLSVGEKLDRVMFVSAILLLAALALTGCATAPVTTERQLADRIPASLLQCAGRPAAGSLDRQSDVARWVVELDQAGEDCRRKVQATAQIVESEGKER